MLRAEPAAVRCHMLAPCLFLASSWMLSRSPCEVHVPCVATGLSLHEPARGEQVWQGSCVLRAESGAVRRSSGVSSVPQYTCVLVNRVQDYFRRLDITMHANLYNANLSNAHLYNANLSNALRFHMQ